MFSIEGFLQTLDTGFRIYKCKILLNTIILLNQIKAYLYFYWKLMLSFRHYKSWCFNRLVRAKGMKFDFCKWSWCLYKVLVAQLGPILCDSMDCNPPHSSVHAIFLARILEWIAIPSSRGSSQPRDWTTIYSVHLMWIDTVWESGIRVKRIQTDWQLFFSILHLSKYISIYS